MPRLPYLKFYPSDWRGEVLLRSCSASARGVWVEMILAMHEAEPRGYLRVGDRDVTEADVEMIARISAVKVPEARKALDELRTAGVYSVSESGVIFSRRIVREENQRAKDRDNGRRGGNPSLIRRDNQGVNPPDNGQVKAHSADLFPEARDQSVTHLPTVGALSDGEPPDPAPKPKVTRLSPEVHGPDFGDLEPDVLVYLRNAADANKTRLITAGRAAALRAELQTALEQIGNREAFAHGLRTANAKGAPNANYVRRAAESYRPAGAPTRLPLRPEIPPETLSIYAQLERKARGEA